MSKSNFTADARHEDVRVAKDPQTEQQYPSQAIFAKDESGDINKTSWLPSGKNKIEHRHEKHPEEYKPHQARTLLRKR